jgi:gamma-glutamylaminecyclotransferase
MPRVRLFVYGTLKRGFAREDLMNGATFDGAAMTQRGYALYDLGEYPALVLGTDGVVHGEVYRVTPEHLEALDRYEGYPELYGREPVALADGSMAVAYVMSGARLGRSPRIEGGLWKSSG